MHLWISEMYHALFNGFPQRLNAHCFPPRFQLDHADGELHLEPLLFIRGDALNVSLLLVSDTLRIGQAPGGGFCLSIRLADLKLQSLVGGHLYSPKNLVFGGGFLSGKFFGEFASGTGCLGPDFLQ